MSNTEPHHVVDALADIVAAGWPEKAIAAVEKRREELMNARTLHQVIKCTHELVSSLRETVLQRQGSR